MVCGITFKAFNGCPQPGYLVISGSNRHGSDLFIVRLAKDDPPSLGCDGEVVARIQLDDVLGHAGGLSMLGSILAVPMHGGSPRVAKVVFYDLAEPESPRRLPVEIARPGRKASATALTRLHNGHYLVAVLAAFDGLPLRVDFYLSRSTVLDDGFLPEPVCGASPVSKRAPVRIERSTTSSPSTSSGRRTDVCISSVSTTASGRRRILPGRDYADLYEVRVPEGHDRG